MARLSISVDCPACRTPMAPRVLACPECKLRIESDFAENEFSRLEGEWLHLLRIFIHCEGRIRDMEAALGISYPTVKARIAELKNRLGLDVLTETFDESPGSDVSEILAELERGEIAYAEAMKRIRGKA